MGWLYTILLIFCSISILESKTPFPTTPVDFWNFALKQEYYAPGHVFLGVTLFPEFKRPDGTILNTGPFIGGLIATIGIRDASGSGQLNRQKRTPPEEKKQGNNSSTNGTENERMGRGFGFSFPTFSSKKNKEEKPKHEQKHQSNSGSTSSSQDGPNSNQENRVAVQLLLKVIDFTFINLDGTILIEFDRDRPPAPSGVIVTLDPEKVFKKFAADFTNPLRLIQLGLGYATDPKKFLHSYLELFYPASIDLNFHIKIQPMPLPVGKLIFDRLSNNTLKNRDFVSLSAPDATTFPPVELGFYPKNKIELIDPSTNQTIVEIHKWTTQFTHTDDEKFCQSFGATKLTANFIKDIFDKFGRTETGQPKLPGKNTTFRDSSAGSPHGSNKDPQGKSPDPNASGGLSGFIEIDIPLMLNMSVEAEYYTAKQSQYKEVGQPKEYENMDKANATNEKVVIVNKKVYYRKPTTEELNDAPEGEEDAKKESFVKPGESGQDANDEEYYTVKKTHYTESGQPKDYDSLEKAKTTNDKVVVVNKNVYYRKSTTEEFKEAPENEDDAKKEGKQTSTTTTTNDGNSTTTVTTTTTVVDENGKTTTSENSKNTTENMTETEYYTAKEAHFKEAGQPKDYDNIDNAKTTSERVVIVNKKVYYRKSNADEFKEAPEGEDDAKKASFQKSGKQTTTTTTKENGGNSTVTTTVVDENGKPTTTEAKKEVNSGEKNTATSNQDEVDYYSTKKSQYKEGGQPKEYDNKDKAKVTNDKIIIVSKKVYYRKSTTDEFKEAPESEDDAKKETFVKSGEHKQTSTSTTTSDGNSTTTVITTTTVVEENGKTTTTEDRKDTNLSNQNQTKSK